MIKTLKLKTGDFWDKKNDVFCVFRRFTAKTIEMDVQIKTGRNLIDCYLERATYIPPQDTYMLEYRPYDLDGLFD